MQQSPLTTQRLWIISGWMYALMDNEQARTVGAKHVVYETIKELKLEEALGNLGFNKPVVDAAIGTIAARLIAPGSERATHGWLTRDDGAG